jgi:hypothetical protein
VYTFGGARSFGSGRAVALRGPVVDAVGTASGKGYALLASNGQIWPFGDFRYFGSIHFSPRAMVGFVAA